MADYLFTRKRLGLVPGLFLLTCYNWDSYFVDRMDVKRLQKRNYFDQHADNHHKTVWLNVLLPFIMLIVIPALYFLMLVILVFTGVVKFKAHESLASLATMPQVWLATVGIVVVWYAGILLYTRYQLHDSIEKVMKQVQATQVNDTFGNRDLKQRMLVNVVNELAIAYGIKPPAVYIIEDTQELNALAVGDRQNSGVAITQPLLEKLNRSDLSGVMGHELSHVVNEDSQVVLRFISYIVGLSVLVVVGQFLYRIGWQSSFWRSDDDDDDDDSSTNLWALLLGLGGVLLILLGYVARWAAILLRFTMSRTREYDADAMSAQVNQSPAGLISALSKLATAAVDSDDNVKRSKKQPSSSRYAALYFADERPDKHHLFDDHPTIEARIKRLKAL